MCVGPRLQDKLWKEVLDQPKKVCDFWRDSFTQDGLERCQLKQTTRDFQWQSNLRRLDKSAKCARLIRDGGDAARAVAASIVNPPEVDGEEWWPPGVAPKAKTRSQMFPSGDSDSSADSDSESHRARGMSMQKLECPHSTRARTV